MNIGTPLQDNGSPDLARQQWAATIEAIIFASSKPVRLSDLQNQLPEGLDVAELVPMIEARFDATSGIELCRVGDSLAFRTRAAIA